MSRRRALIYFVCLMAVLIGCLESFMLGQRGHVPMLVRVCVVLFPVLGVSLLLWRARRFW